MFREVTMLGVFKMAVVAELVMSVVALLKAATRTDVWRVALLAGTVVLGVD
jgi:hypothetical protein